MSTIQTPAQPAEGSGALVRLPGFDDLSRWVDLLSTLADEAHGERSTPAAGTEDAAVRALQLTELNLWLVSALRIRVALDAGQPTTLDPDALPVSS
jgi:hypothetical protein